MKNNNILLFSGGIDSYIGFHYITHVLNKNAQPMYFNYSGSACSREQIIARSLLPQTKIIQNIFNLNTVQSHDQHSTLFGRNLYFCIYAAQYTKKYIYLCGLKNSEMLDNTPDFYKTASDTLTQIAGKEIIVTSPFFNMEKEEIVQWYIENNFHFNTLLRTTSCYHPTKDYCGECLNCFYLYCALYRYTDKLDFINLEIIKNELDQVKKGNRSKYRSISIRAIARKKEFLYEQKQKL